jgi:hypothetical protein
MAIIVNDNPKTLADAVAEIKRRRDNHREWCRLVTDDKSGKFALREGATLSVFNERQSMARAYDNALRFLRSCGAAP